MESNDDEIISSVLRELESQATEMGVVFQSDALDAVRDYGLSSDRHDATPLERRRIIAVLGNYMIGLGLENNGYIRAPLIDDAVQWAHQDPQQRCVVGNIRAGFQDRFAPDLPPNLLQRLADWE